MKVYGTAVLDYTVDDMKVVPFDVSTRFVVSDTKKFVLSAGELERHV